MPTVKLMIQEKRTSEQPTEPTLEGLKAPHYHFLNKDSQPSSNFPCLPTAQGLSSASPFVTNLQEAWRHLPSQQAPAAEPRLQEGWAHGKSPCTYRPHLPRLGAVTQPRAGGVGLQWLWM